MMKSMSCPSKFCHIRREPQAVDKVRIRRTCSEDRHALERIDIARSVDVAVLHRKASAIPSLLCDLSDMQVMHARRVGNEVDRMPELCLRCPL